MEPHEAHRGSQNAAAPGREIAGKNRCAVGGHQEAAAAGQVILHGTECSLYYRLVSKQFDFDKGERDVANIKGVMLYRSFAQISLSACYRHHLHVACSDVAQRAISQWHDDEIAVMAMKTG